MRHIDPETLALLALGERAAGAEADQHLRGCGHCAAEIEALREVVDLGRAAAPLRGTLTPPPPHLWDRIREGVDVTGAGAPAPVEASATPPIGGATARNGRAEPAAGGAPHRPLEPAEVEVETPGPRRRRAAAAAGPGRRGPQGAPGPGRPGPEGTSGPAPWPTGAGRGRRRGLLAGLGALVVIVAAVVAAGALPRGRTVGTVALESLEPGAAGAVALVEDRTGRALRIDDPQLTEVDGYYEVWLASTELDRLVSLGPYVPGQPNRVPEAVDLAAYPVVDVSIEPVDGDPAHSTRSVLRGTLPS